MENLTKKSEPGKPLVSVITIVFNGEKYLEKTIQSVLNQTYENIEYIIIDGGSNDATLDIIKKHEDKIAYWISEPDRGISDAFNKGLARAHGEIIAFLNSGDYYPSPNVIERVIEEFNKDRTVHIVYGKVRLVSPDTEETLAIKGSRFDVNRMKRCMIMPHPTIFASRKVYSSTGKFNPDYKIAMDYDYFFRAQKHFTPFFIDEILAALRLGGKSDMQMFKGFRECYKVHRENGLHFFESSKILIANTVKSFSRLSLEKLGLYGIVHWYRKLTGQI